jgi:hypothetical protein
MIQFLFIFVNITHHTKVTFCETYTWEQTGGLRVIIGTCYLFKKEPVLVCSQLLGIHLLWFISCSF